MLPLATARAGIVLKQHTAGELKAREVIKSCMEECLADLTADSNVPRFCVEALMLLYKRLPCRKQHITSMQALIKACSLSYSIVNGNMPRTYCSNEIQLSLTIANRTVANSPASDKKLQFHSKGEAMNAKATNFNIIRSNDDS